MSSSRTKATDDVIRITDKKDCCGCNACTEICPHHCIPLKTDHEGFRYPEVDWDQCTHCKACVKVCPIIHNDHTYTERLESSEVFAAYNLDDDVRVDSTSGGIFSALAEKTFDLDGYVSGAVFRKDHTVNHIVTNDRSRLDEIRSSKYLQSDIDALYKQIRRLLMANNKVLICAAPCQIAGLYTYLRKDHPNLITCDFICLGVNSPKVFLKYMDMLEIQHGAKATKIKFKNKTYGWHRFSTRIDFENGKTYIKDRYNDAFMVGYLKTHLFLMPACHRCEFKGLPGQADLTLADYWGVEKNHPELDNDTGTSLVIVNSDKGRRFIKGLDEKIILKQISIEDALPYNPALPHSVKEPPRRDEFFADLDRMNFDALTQKYFPVPNISSKGKTVIRKCFTLIRTLGWSPRAYLQFIYYNLLRKNPDGKRSLRFVPTPHCCVTVDKSARLECNGKFLLGFKQFKRSKRETNLYVGKEGSLTVNKAFTVYSGSDIRVYPNGHLTLNSGFCNNGVEITCGKKVTIGNGCAIARDVIIRDYDAHHIVQSELDHETAREIQIGDHVWIGNRAMILKGVTVGDGAIVAAGAIVTRDVPPKSLVAGIPAKVIRENVTWE